MNKTDEDFRNDALFDSLVIPISKLIEGLDIRSFAIQLSHLEHRPYKQVSTLLGWWSKGNRHYTRALFCAKKKLTGFQEIVRTRNRLVGLLSGISEKDCPIVDSHKRTFWSKELRDAANRIKYDVGLVLAERGNNYLTSKGIVWSNYETILEWQGKNTVSQIMLEKRDAFKNPSDWRKIGELWAAIDWFHTSYSMFKSFESGKGISKDGTIDKEINNCMSYRQIVLLYYYKGEKITLNNADDIASAHEIKSATRKQQLFKRWEEWGNEIAITTELNSRQLKPLLKDIQSIIGYLNKEQQQKAENHITHIKKQIS